MASGENLGEGTPFPALATDRTRPAEYSPPAGEPPEPEPLISSPPSSGGLPRFGVDEAFGAVPPSLVPAPATSAALPTRFVFALGRLVPRAPTPAVEHELARLAGAENPEARALRAVLADGQGQYVARQLAWLFTVCDAEPYFVTARDPAAVSLLSATVREERRPTDLDLVVGVHAAAPPVTYGDVTAPVVIAEHVETLEREELLRAALPRHGTKRDRGADAELFDRFVAAAGAAHATDQRRALTYVAVRYPPVYAHARNAQREGASVVSVTAGGHRLIQNRNIVDVILEFGRNGTPTHHVLEVDVTEMLPFVTATSE